MQFTVDHQFHASVPRVMSMFADQKFAAHRAQVSGDESGSAHVDGTSDTAFTVSIRRTVPATSIPAEFRKFVGKDLLVRYSEAWQAPDADDRVGTFAVEIAGAPGHVSGAIGLTPEGEGSTFLVTGDISVSVPIFGGMIERAVADAVTKGLEAEFASADEWLARQ